MSKDRDFGHGDVFYASWTDAIQEMLSSNADNFRLTLLNTTTIRAIAGTGRDQAGLAIDGLYRWRTTNYDVAGPGGAAGTHTIWAVAPSANSFTAPDTDTTNRNFELRITTGAAPGGVTAYRKVGEATWSGSAYTQLRQTAGLEDGTAPIRPTAPLAGVTPLVVRGAASQSAPLQRWEDSAGAVIASMNEVGRLDRVTHPTVPAARVTRAGNLVITTGALTAVPFDTERFDSEAIHSTASNTTRLTCVTPGLYHIYGCIGWFPASGGNLRKTCIRRTLAGGGSAEIVSNEFGPDNATVTHVQPVSTDFILAVGDYVELCVQHDLGSDLSVERIDSKYPEFGMTWLGP